MTELSLTAFSFFFFQKISSERYYLKMVQLWYLLLHRMKCIIIVYICTCSVSLKCVCKDSMITWDTVDSVVVVEVRTPLGPLILQKIHQPSKRSEAGPALILLPASALVRTTGYLEKGSTNRK